MSGSCAASSRAVYLRVEPFVRLFVFAALTETVKEGMTGASKLAEDPETRGDAIRKRFLDFYAARGHKVLPSSSLVPDDPTVLLTIAGMLQFKPIFLGQVPRSYPCATTTQKVSGRESFWLI